MHCPNAFSLADTTAGQLRGPLDGLAGNAKRNDPLMDCYVGQSTCIFASLLSKVNSLTLALTARLVIIVRHLQSQFQQQLLHGFKDDSGDSVGLGGEVRQVYEAWNRKPCPLVSN
jgi:hypothetical protein